jgi:ferredoxin
VDAIHLEKNQAVINDDCRVCGRCVEVCPEQAISLTIENASYVEKTIDRISELVVISGDV